MNLEKFQATAREVPATGLYARHLVRCIRSLSAQEIGTVLRCLSDHNQPLYSLVCDEYAELVSRELSCS